MNQKNYAIIMAGGVGTRFWPLSRTQYPKQFHDFLGTGKTLLQMTWERFREFLPPENILVVTNRNYTNLVKEQLPEILSENILSEPVGRNTAPCILYAAKVVEKKSPSASIIFAPSDHLILKSEKFKDDVSLGYEASRKKDIILTLGVSPTRPDTGYGYIQFTEQNGIPGCFKVKTFTEKPDIEMAKTFVRSGEFLWNTGIFISRAEVMIKEFKEYLPEMHELFSSITSALGTPEEEKAVEGVYSKCKNISIDYGIMEKTKNVYLIRASFDWSDLGTWGSIYGHMDRDYLQNAVKGKAMIFNSSGNLVLTTKKGKLVVLDGLTDFIVVDTDDVLLICKKEDEQEIREIVNNVKKEYGEGYV